MTNTPKYISSFISAISPDLGIVLDNDDVLVCTEQTAAEVTANHFNTYLKAVGKKEIPANYVSRNYSGLNFPKQVEKLQKEFCITLPDGFKDENGKRDLKELSIKTLPIPGAEEVLKFIQEFRINAIVLTSSKPERAEAAIKCAGLETLLTTDLSDDMRTRVISGGAGLIWEGKEIPHIPHKPDPGGYILMAKLIGLPPNQLVAFEDSAFGVEAAYKAGYGAIGLVSLSRRCSLIPDHLENLQRIIQNDNIAIPVSNSWAPAIEAALTLGLKAARNEGKTHLPEKLPNPVRSWLYERFPKVQALSVR